MQLEPYTMPRAPSFGPMHLPVMPCTSVWNLRPNRNCFNGGTSPFLQILARFGFPFRWASPLLTGKGLVGRVAQTSCIQQRINAWLADVSPWWRAWPSVAQRLTYILAPVSASFRFPCALSCTSLPWFPLQTSWPPNYFPYLQPRSWTHLFLLFMIFSLDFPEGLIWLFCFYTL